MRRSLRRSLCAGLFGLLMLFAQTAIAGDAPWIEVRSQNFTVITDAGEKNGRHAADRFEQMRTIFGLLYGREKINQPVPLEIIAFRNSKELRQYSPLFRGKVVELAGFFQQADDKDFIAVDMSQEDNWQTVFHEYAHVLLNSNYPATAPWFDEGFAEYLSSLKVSPGDVEIGRVIPDAAFLTEGNTLHLVQLFQVQHHSETYNVSGTRREMFYVQSWLVVHYLFDHNLIPDTSKYFQLTNVEKVPVEQAIQTAFGVPAAQLEKDILTYLRGNKVKVLRYTGKEKVALAYDATARPLTPLETKAELADLHLHSADYVSLGMKEFEEVVQADPNQVEAQRGLGYAYLRTGDLSKAAEHLRAAAKLGSTDARVYYYSAVLLQRSDPGALSSPQLAQDLHRAIELDPQYADAYALLGESLVNTGKYAEGEQNLRHAAELSPRNEIIRLNYALALVDEQKMSDGEAVLNSVANGSDPTAAEHAKEALQKIQEYKTQTAQFQASPNPGTREVAAVNESAPPEPEATRVIPSAPAKYLQGTLTAIDCSAPPSAVLTVVSGGQTFTLKVQNTEHAILIGADKFSCSWNKRKVGVNYRVTGAAAGDVISLEIQ